MAIANIQTINVGLPNESVGSDSLYVAFTKANTNFNILANYASPYSTFVGGNGISTVANTTSNTVTITNTGVTQLNAGTGITLSGTTGNITISSNGGGNGSGGTVTSVGLTPVSNTRLTVTNSPIVSSGSMSIDLALSGVNAATYTNPTVTVDSFGRITQAANGATIANVGITPGTGIAVTNNSSNGNYQFTVINTGVTALSAGTGIQLSGNSGVVTISSPVTGGTVTYVGVTSSSLNVTGSPIASTGTIDIESPIGFFSENLTNGNAANLSVTASYITTSGSSTATLATGAAGQVKTFMMVTHGGDMVITVSNAGWKSSGTGTATFSAVGQGCTLQYIDNKWFCIGNNGVTFG
jgi:hypothetical protein